jgi:hypothetical protein
MTYIQLLHGSNKPTGTPRGIRLRIVQLESFEIPDMLANDLAIGRLDLLGSTVRTVVPSCALVDCLDKTCVDPSADNGFHHS